MLIKFRAKVRMITELQMEVDYLDVEWKDAPWKWTTIAIPACEIYKLVSFSRGKTVVHLYEGEKILAGESLNDLMAKWEEAKIIEKQLFGEQNNQESEETSEEEEE